MLLSSLALLYRLFSLGFCTKLSSMIKVDVIFINAIDNAIFVVIVIQIIIVLTLPSLRMGESGRGIKKRTSYAALSSQPV